MTQVAGTAGDQGAAPPGLRGDGWRADAVGLVGPRANDLAAVAAVAARERPSRLRAGRVMMTQEQGADGASGAVGHPAFLESSASGYRPALSAHDVCKRL